MILGRKTLGRGRHVTRPCDVVYCDAITHVPLANLEWMKMHIKETFWWLSARLWYLHCVSNADTTVLHWGINLLFQSLIGNSKMQCRRSFFHSLSSSSIQQFTMETRCNSIANTLGFCLFCIKSSIWHKEYVLLESQQPEMITAQC